MVRSKLKQRLTFHNFVILHTIKMTERNNEESMDETLPGQSVKLTGMSLSKKDNVSTEETQKYYTGNGSNYNGIMF
jgi:hypothetical protein